MIRSILVANLVLSCAATAFAGSAESYKNKYKRPSNIPAPKDNPTTKEKVELGKKLFFDPRLSSSNWISCATCHNPALG